ncbi:MAG: HIT family protein [Myxococcaceae bacterium]
MEALWAPWRMDFINGQKPSVCIFCVLPSESGEAADQKNLILGRSEHSFTILNRYPYNSGHLMVIPRRHGAELTGLADPEFADLHRLLKLSIEIVKEAYRPEGFNIGMNLGKLAGAGIPEHLHYHVVPRWSGDTNFMPVLSSTKVIVEHLDAAHAKLRPLFDHRLAGS